MPTLTEPKTGLEFLWSPPGDFAMGTTAKSPEIEADARPVHQVRVSGFWMDAHPVTNADMSAAIGQALHRPSMVPVPAFAPRLALGREMADSLLFVSQRVHPEVLVEAGYRFTHPDVASGLAAAFGSRP